MAAVGERGLVPEAVTAAGQGQHVQVADVGDRAVTLGDQPAALPGEAGQAGALGEVLLLGGPAPCAAADAKTQRYDPVSHASAVVEGDGGQFP